jgi:hypothetical protein
MLHDPDAIPLIGGALNLAASLIRLLASMLDGHRPAPIPPPAPATPGRRPPRGHQRRGGTP